MLERFDAGALLVALSGLSNFSRGIHNGSQHALPKDNLDDQKRQIDLVCHDLNRMGLVTSLECAKSLKKIIFEESKDLPEDLYHLVKSEGIPLDHLAYYDVRAARRFRARITDLMNRVRDEFKSKITICIDPPLSQFYEQPKPLFGKSVFDKFSTANYDIEEAGKCLALERSTACVMHLQRALEAGLKSLAKSLGVGQRNDWGSYIRDIEKALDKQLEAAGKRSDEEKFYAEANVSFDRLKRAYRNPSMHLESRYEQPQARDIFDSIRSFMQHLATRLSE